MIYYLKHLVSEFREAIAGALYHIAAVCIGLCIAFGLLMAVKLYVHVCTHPVGF